jgi:hypothetical protein
MTVRQQSVVAVVYNWMHPVLDACLQQQVLMMLFGVNILCKTFVSSTDFIFIANPRVSENGADNTSSLVQYHPTPYLQQFLWLSQSNIPFHRPASYPYDIPLPLQGMTPTFQQ